MVPTEESTVMAVVEKTLVVVRVIIMVVIVTERLNNIPTPTTTLASKTIKGRLLVWRGK